ncbi:MAG: acetyl-CoA hydrolase/transferase family protein [Desulfitobacteriaceae bacterium]
MNKDNEKISLSANKWHDWRKDYHGKLVSAEEAVKVVKSGDFVILQHACAEPRTLVEALVKRRDLSEVRIAHMVAIGPAEYAQPGMERYFRHNSFFVGEGTRQAVNEGRADFTPLFFHELPRVLQELRVDVAMIQVSPPNKWGFCSLGVSVDYTKAACQTARVVIAQVNELMPWTYGDTFVHISDIDRLIESTRPLLEVPSPPITPVERTIGEHIAGLIEDGSTLQLGIGAIPDAVLLSLQGKKDLGIHTEMFSDKLIDLVESGVVTCTAKNLNRGKIICSFFLGTKRLYDFVDDNPMIEFRTVDYTNDPVVIGRHDGLVSINSAVEVDLLGQVCADTIGYTQYSAVGGQVDFVRGAARSKGGKAIIAMPSSAAGGKVSRIVPLLKEGAVVTTSRNDVQYVVTEYGVADLRAKTNRERAGALISVAHPDHRENLGVFARKRNLI